MCWSCEQIIMSSTGWFMVGIEESVCRPGQKQDSRCDEEARRNTFRFEKEPEIFAWSGLRGLLPYMYALLCIFRRRTFYCHFSSPARVKGKILTLVLVSWVGREVLFARVRVLLPNQDSQYSSERTKEQALRGNLQNHDQYE